jgi:membrane fusion protein, multidrug efflux system
MFAFRGLVYLATLGFSFTNLCASDFEAHGMLRSIPSKIVTTNFSARVLQLPVVVGQYFNAGDSLIVFDCRQFDPAIDEAEQFAAKALAQYSVDLKKLSLGQLARSAADKSFLQVYASEKRFQALHQQVSDCDLKAPFQGRLEQEFVQMNQSPAPNQALLKISNTSRLAVEFDLTGRGLGGLEPGSPFSFSIDGTGKHFEAALMSIASTTSNSNPILKVYGEFPADNSNLKPGMSTTAIFKSLNN